MRRKFFSTYVGWPEAEMPALHALIDDSSRISREAFLPLVSLSGMRGLERALGYDRHLKMADDRHVSYHVHPSGIPFFVHSAIEHVFSGADEISALTRSALIAEMEPGSFLIDDVAGLYRAEAEDADAYDDRLTEFLDTLRPGVDLLVVVDPDGDIDRLHGGLRAQIVNATTFGREGSGIFSRAPSLACHPPLEKVLPGTRYVSPCPT